MFIIYGTPNCGYCSAAVELLEDNDLEYEYHDIAGDLDKRNEVIQKVPGFKTVPQIFEDDSYVGGYTDLRDTLLIE